VVAFRKRRKRAQRALSPITRESLRESGEVVREFDLRSAAMVLGAFVGSVFLIFFLIAFLPWLLANGMTAAVEGMMRQVGFDDFRANTLVDWVLVLLFGGVFTAFIVAVAVSILALYNVISKRTDMGLRVMTELPRAEPTVALEPPARAKPKKAASKKASSTKRTSKRSGASSRRS